MPNALSRLLVAAAALPVVLGAVYLGGWWLFALLTLGSLIGLHEFWLLTRPLSPLSPAGYVGALLGLVGAELGGLPWMVGGLLTAFPLAFALKGISAMVKIFFTVNSDGSIRPHMRIVRSSGYAELDSLAEEALKEWKFSPTTASSSSEEAWGVITFRFTLA